MRIAPPPRERKRLSLGFAETTTARMRTGLLVLVMWGVVASGQTPPSERTHVVSLGLNTPDPALKGLSEVLSDMLMTELGRAPTLEIVGPRDLVVALGLERQRQLLGCSEQESCLAEMSAALGAPWVVTGSMTRLGDSVRLDVRLIQTKDGRAVFRDGATVPNDEHIFSTLTRLAHGLLKSGFGVVLTEPDDPWPPEVEAKPEALQSKTVVAPVPPRSGSLAPLWVAIGVVAAGLIAGGVVLGVTANQPPLSTVQLSW